MSQKNKILLSVGVFIFSYCVLLVFWVQVKAYYGKVLSQAGAMLAASHTKCHVEYLKQQDDETEIRFSRVILTPQGIGDVVFDMKLRVSNYTFNLPLTFALAAGLYGYFHWKLRYLMEAAVILVFVHLLYIFSYCSFELLKNFSYSQEGVEYGIQGASNLGQLFFKFLWTFTDNMVIRFEPFLVAIYLWLGNTACRRPQSAA